MIVVGCCLFFFARSYLLLFTDVLVDAFVHNPSRVVTLLDYYSRRRLSLLVAMRWSVDFQ